MVDRAETQQGKSQTSLIRRRVVSSLIAVKLSSPLSATQLHNRRAAISGGRPVAGTHLGDQAPVLWSVSFDKLDELDVLLSPGWRGGVGGMQSRICSLSTLRAVHPPQSAQK